MAGNTDYLIDKPRHDPSGTETLKYNNQKDLFVKKGLFLGTFRFIAFPFRAIALLLTMTMSFVFGSFVNIFLMAKNARYLHKDKSQSFAQKMVRLRTQNPVVSGMNKLNQLVHNGFEGLAWLIAFVPAGLSMAIGKAFYPIISKRFVNYVYAGLLLEDPASIGGLLTANAIVVVKKYLDSLTSEQRFELLDDTRVESQVKNGIAGIIDDALRNNDTATLSMLLTYPEITLHFHNKLKNAPNYRVAHYKDDNKNVAVVEQQLNCKFNPINTSSHDDKSSSEKSSNPGFNVTSNPIKISENSALQGLQALDYHCSDDDMANGFSGDKLNAFRFPYTESDNKLIRKTKTILGCLTNENGSGKLLPDAIKGAKNYHASMVRDVLAPSILFGEVVATKFRSAMQQVFGRKLNSNVPASPVDAALLVLAADDKYSEDNINAFAEAKKVTVKAETLSLAQKLAAATNRSEPVQQAIAKVGSQRPVVVSNSMSATVSSSMSASSNNNFDSMEKMQEQQQTTRRKNTSSTGFSLANSAPKKKWEFTGFSLFKKKNNPVAMVSASSELQQQEQSQQSTFSNLNCFKRFGRNRSNH